MKKYRRLILVAVALALVIAAIPTGMALAATTQNVTITAQPTWLTISNSPSTWTLNEETGDSFIDVDTIYYANPLGDTTQPTATVIDGECRFTVDTTGSSVAVDLSVNSGNFTNSLMDNSGTGANSATDYGGYSYYSGGSNAGVVMAESGSGVLIDAMAKDTTKKWGAWIETRTDAWDSGTSCTATMTMSAVEDT